MDYGSLAARITSFISYFNNERSNINNIEFLSNWMGITSDKFKHDIEELSSSIGDLRNIVEKFVQALKYVDYAKTEESKIRTLEIYIGRLNYNSQTSDSYTISKYQSAMRDKELCKSTKKKYIEQAKSCLNSISEVGITIPSSIPVIPNDDYSYLAELNNVFDPNSSLSSFSSFDEDEDKVLTSAISSNTTGYATSAAGFASLAYANYGGSSSSANNYDASEYDASKIENYDDAVVTAVTSDNLTIYGTGYAFPIENGANYYISSKYGPRKSFRTKAGYTGSFHHGVDIAVAAGTPVHATLEGEVVGSGWDNNGAGNYVKIRHPDGKESRYYHLSSRDVKVGQKIKQGDIIGKVGSTGRATGPHLHFEVRDSNGNSMDPQKYLFVNK